MSAKILLNLQLKTSENQPHHTEMTITLIVLLIITLLALVILPFSKALMKDRAELHENPLDKKFAILISRINQLLMNGRGEVVKFEEDPRMLNLFDENHANMIINFYYSTGTLAVTLKYKYFQVELVKKMEFHDMRQAESFRQMDAANHFVEEANIAIRKHQETVGKQQGFVGGDGDLKFTDSEDDELMPQRAMYNSLNREQKLELLNMARVIFLADGSLMSEFRESAVLRQLHLNLQIDYDTYDREVATRPTYADMKHLYQVDRTMTILTMLPVVAESKNNPDARMEYLYKALGQIGMSREQVDGAIKKMALMMDYFDA